MIEVKIESIRISLMSPNQVVILKEIDGPRCLPVFIGKPEGDAITFKLNHVEVPRPLSHDLAASMIEALDAKVSHVLIKELRGSHFIAALHFQGASGDARGVTEIDARPSDAIAIAVRVSCPIFVEDAVMSAAGVIPPAEAAGDDDLGAFSDFIGSLDLGDLDDEDKSR
jgi:bifunctional DNase/RNase